MFHKTKIIATVGPSSRSREALVDLYHAGVNVIRFNFSHANHAGTKELLDIIRELNDSGVTNLSTLLDTKWPELRTGDAPAHFPVTKGMEFVISHDPEFRFETYGTLVCDYPYLATDLVVGDCVKIDSWLLNVRVVRVLKGGLLVISDNELDITPRRHVNLPGVKIRLPGITEKDQEDIRFGIGEDFDFIAMSFVRNRDNVTELREFLDSHHASHIRIISKIENQEGIENVREIIEASDGVMVARGDLGIEVPIEKLPVYQRMIIDEARSMGKFTIVATHILESMIVNPFPTRAEVSDIYHSVEQHADAIMLSGETANGKYPVVSAQTMRQIADEAEKHVSADMRDFSNAGLSPRDQEKKYLLKSALEIADSVHASAVLVFTKTGLLARLISAFKPNIPVYSFTSHGSTIRYTNLLFSIVPMLLPEWKQHSDNLESAIKMLLEKWLVDTDTKLVVVTDIIRNGKDIPVLEILNVSEFVA